MKIKIFISFIFIIFCANLSFAFSEKDKLCEDYMLKGMAAVDAKNFSLALEYVLKAKDCGIDQFTYKGILAQCYNLNKEHKKAHKLAKEIIQLDPKRFDGYKILGDTYLYKGNYAASIDFYKRAMTCKNCSDEMKVKLEQHIKDVIKKQNSENGYPKPVLNYTINLDKKIWELAYFNADENQSLSEYGLIGENVLEYEWTKLITVNYYDKNYAKSSFKEICQNVKNVRINHAKELNYQYAYRTLSEENNDAIFFFTNYGKKEYELIRVFETKEGFYCVRYDIKNKRLVGKERADAFKILKSVKPKKENKSAFEKAFTPVGWVIGGVATPAILAIDLVDTAAGSTLAWTFDNIIAPIGLGFEWTGQHIFAPIGKSTWWGVRKGFHYASKGVDMTADGITLGLKYTLKPTAKAIWKYGIKPVGYYTWEFSVMPLGKVTWTILTKTDDYILDPVFKGIDWTLDQAITATECGFEYVLIPIGEGTVWGIKTTGKGIGKSLKYTFVPVAKATTEGLEYIFIPIGKGVKWSASTIGSGIAKGAEYTVVPVIDGVVWSVDNMITPVVKGVESGVNSTISAIGEAIHTFAWR